METLIRQRLSTSEFAGKLSIFNGEPAIFCHKAPDDSTELSYPHAIFTVDKFSDAIHGVAGLLTVEIFCTQETIRPELPEILLRRSLEGVFFKPVDGEIFALKWQKTDLFREPASERLPLIIGVVTTFEVREFPSAEVASPDPIQALNLWAARWEPNLIVLGLTETAEIFEPTFERPVVYFDAQRTRMTTLNHTSAGLETVANAHVFCSGIANRRRWTMALLCGLICMRAIFLADGAPMRLTACEQNFAADEIQGQLTLTLEYGLLRPLPYAHPLVSKVTDFDGKLKRTCKPQPIFNEVSRCTRLTN